MSNLKSSYVSTDTAVAPGSYVGTDTAVAPGSYVSTDTAVAPGSYVSTDTAVAPGSYVSTAVQGYSRGTRPWHPARVQLLKSRRTMEHG